MAIGTTGGKIGCLTGPLVALVFVDMAFRVFRVTEDGSSWNVIASIIVLSVIALAAGLGIRLLVNKLLDRSRVGTE